MLFSLQTDGHPLAGACLFSVFMSIMADSAEEDGQLLDTGQPDSMFHRIAEIRTSALDSLRKALFISQCRTKNEFLALN